MDLFFRRYRFVRDGLVSVALALVWLAATYLLCKLHIQMVCDGFADMFGALMSPTRIVTTKLADLAMFVGRVRPPVPDRTLDSLSLWIGIPVNVLYVFLLGGAASMLWRRLVSVRGQDTASRGGLQS
jgi:hypothetical protein